MAQLFPLCPSNLQEGIWICSDLPDHRGNVGQVRRTPVRSDAESDELLLAHVLDARRNGREHDGDIGGAGLRLLTSGRIQGAQAAVAVGHERAHAAFFG